MSQLQIFDTTIKIKSNTRDRLKQLGNLSYTYDMIIAELLDMRDELKGDQS
ncbi:MAG: hypothetical protein HOB51_01010 [Thaumarchaeota archaeon]|jgi:hypothetical protein|nr:hypothetical protein [Nitrososphaerota archaeon]MBT7252154.1 hypothetical protein [Candidatus Nitrosopelagicus sp.]